MKHPWYRTITKENKPNMTKPFRGKNPGKYVDDVMKGIENAAKAADARVYYQEDINLDDSELVQ